MKANKLLKTLAASAMSLALLAGVTVMPAMAAAGDEVQNGSTFTAKSVIQVPVKVAVPNVTLQYTIDETTTVSGDRNGAQLYAGIEGGLFFGTKESKTYTQDVSHTAKAPTQTDGKYYEDAVDFTFTADATSFNHAGVYVYNITVAQKSGVSIEGLTLPNPATQTVYVYVTNNTDTPAPDDMLISAITMGTGTPEAKTGRFVSKYLDDDNTFENYYTVDLSKTLAGAFANMNDTFEFTVTFTENNTSTYYYEKGTIDGEGNFTATDTGIVSGQILTTGSKVTLGHHQAIRIYGLVNDDAFSFTEANKSYAVSYSVNSGATVKNEPVANITIDNADGTVAYTNTLDNVAPTGVILNVAPYALMVVIAVAGVAVFMRKRVED